MLYAKRVTHGAMDALHANCYLSAQSRATSRSRRALLVVLRLCLQKHSTRTVERVFSSPIEVLEYGRQSIFTLGRHNSTESLTNLVRHSIPTRSALRVQLCETIGQTLAKVHGWLEITGLSRPRDTGQGRE